MKGISEQKGIHSNKELPLPRITDASENAARAAQFLSSFKRHGRLTARVDHVATGGRFKLYVPKENAKLTFVLEGI